MPTDVDPTCEGDCFCGARHGEECRTRRHDLLAGKLEIEYLVERPLALLVRIRESLCPNPREWIPLAHVVLRGDGWIVVAPWLRAKINQKHF